MNQHLKSYLIDHLAGSVMAIDLLHQLEDLGTETAFEFGRLRADIESDRDELRVLMEKLHIEPSGLRHTTAWLTAKLAEFKLRLEDHNEGPLRLLETIEAVALGIDGKSALWRALEAAVEVEPELQGTDYQYLGRRAEEQRRHAESIRLVAAKTAFGAVPTEL